MPTKPKKPSLAVDGVCPCCDARLLEPMYTTIEAAEAVGMRPHSLDNLACQKRGPSYAKLGRHRMYSGQALRDFIEARTRKCNAA